MNAHRSRLVKQARQAWNREMDAWDGVALVTMGVQDGIPTVVTAQAYQANLAVPMMMEHDRQPPHVRRAECEGVEIEIPAMTGIR